VVIQKFIQFCWMDLVQGGLIFFMSSKVLRSGVFASLLFALTALVVSAQDTVKKTEVVQNPDGTYSVIEYPVGKEVVVNLVPAPTLTGATGVAHVIRSADGTRVMLDLTSMPATDGSYYAYTVDSTGTTTYLGPLTVANGTARAEFTTPLNQFMLVLSPTEGLKTLDNTAVVFRSEVPKGYAVVPTKITSTGGSKAVAVTDTLVSTYDVPLLGVPAFGERTTEIRIDFAGELSGLKGKAYIDSTKRGARQVKMRFDDMKLAPKDKRFVLWATAPDGTYTKLGQVINSGARQESEIRSETELKDFGLFVTVEDKDVTTPTSKTYSVFSLPKP
jgi:hypothetical protein